LGVASAQIYPPGGGGYPGGYPGGGYPGGYPGRYPGGGVPVPGTSRGGKQGKNTPKTDTGAAYPNFRGKLKHMDDKTISLELGDNRVLDFKRTSKTKFFKNGDEVKSPNFNPGDQISVEGPEEANGYMTAVNVYWEKAAAPAAGDTASASPAHSPDKDKAEGTPDTWKDAPGAPSPAKADTAGGSAKPEASATVVTPAAKDPEDPGRPRLKRGTPADPSREHAPAPPAQAPDQIPAEVGGAPVRPVETAAAAPPAGAPSIRRIGEEDAAPIPIMSRSGDQLIRKATDAALDFTEGLPSYVCQEMMSRFESESNPPNWRPLDVVSMNVVYENGKEDYRDLAVNGKPTKKPIEEVGGAWSTGEFGTVLIDLFSPATAADFHFQRDSRMAGINTKLYDFDVKRENSHWNVHMGSQGYTPPYKGSVWIDPQTGRVMRIEMQAYGFPESFPTDHVESATDYQYIRLGDAKQYLLPVHAETLSCQRGTNQCSRNTIDFRNYHKYTGESTITFGAPK
jgi:hypothetical protein